MNDLHPYIKVDIYNGAVLRDHHSNEFKLVMVLRNSLVDRAWACLYESKSGTWGNIDSTLMPSSNVSDTSVLVGNSLCWMLHLSRGGVLEFDIDKQSLSVIQTPEEIHVPSDSCAHVLRTEQGRLALAIVSGDTIKLWKRTAISDCVVSWVLQKTIDLNKLISPRPSIEGHRPVSILGFDEDNNVIFVWMTVGVFMIQLESMKLTNISSEGCIRCYFPFTSFYTSGLDIGGGDDRDEM